MCQTRSAGRVSGGGADGAGGDGVLGANGAGVVIRGTDDAGGARVRMGRCVKRALQGGFPVGALTELEGTECSGRTGLALSFAARTTQAERVCAWVDVSNALCREGFRWGR